jgi:ribosomal small subunit protein bTHX
MGKGDKKSRRGKIILGTYGVRRRRKDYGKVVLKSNSSQTENPSSENIETSKPPKEVRKAKAPAKPKKEPSDVKETRQAKDTGKPSGPKTQKAKKA